MTPERNVTLELPEDTWEDVEENLARHTAKCEQMLDHVRNRHNGEAEIVGQDLGILVEAGLDTDAEKVEVVQE